MQKVQGWEWWRRVSYKCLSGHLSPGCNDRPYRLKYRMCTKHGITRCTGTICHPYATQMHGDGVELSVPFRLAFKSSTFTFPSARSMHWLLPVPECAITMAANCSKWSPFLVVVLSHYLVNKQGTHTHTHTQNQCTSTKWINNVYVLVCSFGWKYLK